MNTKINEDLFQEIMKLQRKVRQSSPGPREAVYPPHCPPRGDFPPPPRRERILRILLNGEKGLRQKQICEMIGVGAPAMSETIERLEADGYIERIPDPEDRRATRIILTPKGEARAYETQDEHEEHMRELFKNLSEDEKLLLTAFLQKIND